MAASEDKNSKKPFWKQLFPSSQQVDSRNLGGLALPPGSAIYENFAEDGSQLGGVSESGEDGELEITDLPLARLARYNVYRTMATDPTIDSAIKMHISHALSPKADTGEIISIESIGDETDPITLDLRNNIQKIVNDQCQFWAYNAGINGIWFARVYGEDGVGIKQVRSDYYTHPQFVNMYEQAGGVAGYVSAHQQPETGGIQLMEPWKMVPFRIPMWKPSLLEPIRVDASIFDLSVDNYEDDSITESQNYGTSLLETSYGPWMDLNNAILSLNMSRKNASRMERMIGINTGKLSPQKAAQYLNIVAGQMQRVDTANAKRSLKKGFIQTVINHLIPIFGDGRARLDISTIEGTPNIEAINDITFHINRLCGALGVDPSLLGFGENLSGGLGDGGFFRVSVMAAMKAQMLRHAIQTGVEQLCDIHIAYKFKKAFLPGEKPYRIVFNSVSTAMEREEMENREGRVQLATGMAQLVGLMDQEWLGVDKNAFENFLFTDIMKVDEAKFKIMFPKKLAEAAAKKATEEAAAKEKEKSGGGEALMESARSIQGYIDSFYS